MSDDIGHYRVQQKLGSGGMGEVFLAEDTKLRRSVALKLLPREVASDPQRRSRFLQEAQAASMLNHPNVSTIYEVGQSEETVFIAMEYIEGKTLSQVRESRTLETDDVLDIALQVADALDEAGSRGIVHRDIKSANIMLTTRGHVKVLDFGLAKMSRESDAPHDDDTRVKTTPGLVVGTSNYMSPEQALGRPVDHRSDLFSFGVVLYELTTGRLPFSGASVTETIEKITHAQPDPIARFNYAIPLELERIVRKLLEKEPSRRYQTAREVAVDLKNLKRDTTSGEVVSSSPPKRRRKLVVAAAASAAVIAIAIAAFVFTKEESGAVADVTPIDSIAVLPFVNTSKNPETEYLSDGISESIINNLTTISSLRVIPRSTVFRYKGKEIDPQQIARDLNVRAVVSGRVLQRGENLSVQTELVDVASNSQIWGARYERKVGDALALQQEISNEIATRLRQNEGELQSASRKTTADAEAYQLYLKGRYHWNKRTSESVTRSLGYFQQAVERDPRFALAHVGVADSYLLMEQYADRSSVESNMKAEAAARRALEIDGTIAEAHASLGLMHQNRAEWEKSEQAFKRSIELNPRYPTSRHWYNIMLRDLGRNEEALVQVRKAQELDPLSMIIGVNVVDVLTLVGRDDEALATAEKYMEIDPNFPQLLGILARMYSDRGRYAEAIATAKKAVELSDGVTEQKANLALVYAEAGEREPAEAIVDEIERRVTQGKGDSYFLAAAHLALGDRDAAFASLKRSIESGSGMATGLLADDRLIPLRSDPRFAELLRKVNISPDLLRKQ